jgi:hypothetical protein
MFVLYNVMKCLALIGKKGDIQCTRNAKTGEELCGTHLRASNIRTIQPLLSDTIYTCEEYFDNLKENKLIEKRILKTLDYLNFDHNPALLNRYFSNFQVIKNQHINQVKIIQKFIRNFNLLNRKANNNEVDFCSLEKIIDIPNKYYIQLKAKDGLKYAFDIRSLLSFWKEKCINPYTYEVITEEQLDIVNQKKKKLEKAGISLEFEKDELTEEQQDNQLLTNLTARFDYLGYYFNENWLKDLSLQQLKQLYKGAEDIFNYRAELTPSAKKKLVKDGKAFIDIQMIDLCQDKKVLMRKVINELSRFVFDGENKDDCCWGANLMITAIVEISTDCANSFPHLLQAFIE